MGRQTQKAAGPSTRSTTCFGRQWSLQSSPTSPSAHSGSTKARGVTSGPLATQVTAPQGPSWVPLAFLFYVSGYKKWCDTLSLSSLFYAVRAAKTRSGVMGSCVIRTPTASLMALATAAATGTTGGSPTPLAPNGPSSEGTSTSSGVMLGTLRPSGSA